MILSSGVLWGTIGVFVTTLKGLGIDALTAGFLRILFGALILVPIMIAIGGKRLFIIDKKGLVITAILGIFSQALFNYCYCQSITRTGVATASVLLYSAPVFVAIMSAVFYKENMTAAKGLAVLLNVCGCFLTVTGGNIGQLSFSVSGILLGISAGFLYGLMTVISRLTSDKYDPLTVMFYSFLFGAAGLSLAVKPWENISLFLSTPVLLTAVGFGLIPTVGSYMFYLNGMKKKIEVSKVPIIASVEIIVAAAIGMTLFQEHLGIVNVAGIGLVVLSIAIGK